MFIYFFSHSIHINSGQLQAAAAWYNPGLYVNPSKQAVYIKGAVICSQFDIYNLKSQKQFS